MLAIVKRLLALGAFLLALLLPSVSLADDSVRDGLPPGQPSCGDYDGPATIDRAPKRIAKLELKYPIGEIEQLGEGWVRFGSTIDPAGAVQDVWIEDAMGSPVYGERSIEAVRASTYEPGIVDGKPAAFGESFDVKYLIEGENRAQARASYGVIYDRAYEFRSKGEYARSLSVLQEAMKRQLNLYELATMSFALAQTYMGLNDWRRALLHSQHSVLSDGEYADKGVRAAALALNAELLARDNSFHEALCAYASLKEQYPAFVPQAALQDAVSRSRAELGGTQPVRTQVEIVESGRSDVAANWPHRLARPTFAFDQIQGRVERFRLSCKTFVIAGAVEPSKSITVGPGKGVCRLYVFGEPGAKFDLIER